MRKTTFQELSQDYLEQLVKGAFLTVKTEEVLNTMTIGWGTLGYIWNKPVLMVPVRYQRYTYELMEKIETFTVSVPVGQDMKKALAFCGTKSGREVNKFKEMNLTPVPGKKVDTPIIGECNLHIECRIIYKQSMEPGTLAREVHDQSYPKHDFHVMYYGEILEAYYTD
jgi:flavin reductase (DIM6/NTAB) family NADH-FMN oxidoreductase RutF